MDHGAADSKNYSQEMKYAFSSGGYTPTHVGGVQGVLLGGKKGVSQVFKNGKVTRRAG